jgi:CheY-like chemotaxis protein
MFKPFDESKADPQRVARRPGTGAWLAYGLACALAVLPLLDKASVAAGVSAAGLVLLGAACLWRLARSAPAPQVAGAAAGPAAPALDTLLSQVLPVCHAQDHPDRRRLQLAAHRGEAAAQLALRPRPARLRRLRCSDDEAGDGRQALSAAGQGRQGQPDRQRREHAQHGRHHLRDAGQAAPAPQVHAGDHADHRGQDAKKEQGRAAGAKAWIVKPFNPPQLLDAVSKLILP